MTPERMIDQSFDYLQTVYDDPSSTLDTFWARVRLTLAQVQQSGWLAGREAAAKKADYWVGQLNDDFVPRDIAASIRHLEPPA